MLYRLIRLFASVLLRTSFRIHPPRDPKGVLGMPGPVIFVGNHPNGLVDPGVLFILCQRQLTFLGKAPLFSMPLLGGLLRGMGARPVYRKQDDPTQMSRNEGALDAAAQVLVSGGALALFPEGISHSEPQLQALKTGCARIALTAAAAGADVHIVPVGLTFSDKARFRSEVHIEVGAPLPVKTRSGAGAGDVPFEEAQALTGQLAEALRAVTLNVERWEDVQLLGVAESLYARRTAQSAQDAARLLRFASALPRVRAEEPERYERLREGLQLLSRELRRHGLSPHHPGARYPLLPALWFVLRNGLWLVFGLPLFAAGALLFFIPYHLPRLWNRPGRVDLDLLSTVRVLSWALVFPVWLGLLVGAAALLAGPVAALLGLLGFPLLALFSQVFLERRRRALRSANAFLQLTLRPDLRGWLERTSAQLTDEILALAQRYGDAPGADLPAR